MLRYVQNDNFCTRIYYNPYQTVFVYNEWRIVDLQIAVIKRAGF